MANFKVRLYTTSFVDVMVSAEDEAAARDFVEDMFHNEELSDQLTVNESIDYADIEEV